MRKLVTILSLIIFFSNCDTSSQVKEQLPAGIQTGASQINEYLPLLKGKKVGICVNHTSKIEASHLYDSLEALGIKVQTIFTPEHGFTGTADAGEKVKDGKLGSTDVISLYGDHKKPKSGDLDNIDIMVFDIQDVGARFYTYISTMHYLMEACAENDVPLLILDRPNPNGSYIAGPILDTAYRSFVGMHPIPVVHGLTVGELAMMINGEGWLKNGIKCQLTVIPVLNWTHTTSYTLPVKPSPNLPNQTAVSLYPSLCLFEGTVVSVGRGTDYPFQVIGHPDYTKGEFTFTPKPNSGAKYPKLEDEQCRGISFIDTEPAYQFSLQDLIEFYTELSAEGKNTFFNDFFTLLAGTEELRTQIENGLSEEEIKGSWSKDHAAYLKMREQYLIYP